MPTPRPSAASRVVDDDDLAALFEQIAQPQDAAAVELRFVLAWMLIRRRRLRLEGSRRGKLSVRRLSATGAILDDEPLLIDDPELDEDQLEAAADRVARMLLEDDPPAHADTPADTPADTTGDAS